MVNKPGMIPTCLVATSIPVEDQVNEQRCKIGFWHRGNRRGYQSTCCSAFVASYPVIDLAAAPQKKSMQGSIPITVLPDGFKQVNGRPLPSLTACNLLFMSPLVRPIGRRRPLF